MSVEDNKAVVGRWFAEFWGPDYNPAVIDELAAPDIRFEYVVGQWEGGGTQTGDAFDDITVGSLPAGSGKAMRFSQGPSDGRVGPAGRQPPWAVP